jgi:hypothetical protein
MLEWHQLKQVGGLLIAVMACDAPNVAVRLAAMRMGRFRACCGELMASAPDMPARARVSTPPGTSRSGHQRRRVTRTRYR